MRIDGIQPASNPGSQLKHHYAAPDAPVRSFKDTMSAFLKDVNTSQKAASDVQQKFLSGEITNVHEVMMQSEKASVSFNMLMELRNKAMDGYQEIMRTKL